jgi:hypothetical protein
MLPNLIIIGAQKCGTSALHQYLGLHPDIFMSEEKELNFFLEDKNWPRGREWYESNFTVPAKIHGEASPDYTKYPKVQGVAARMHSLVPDAKLIYMVRHPIDRIVSQYIHDRGSGVETRSLSDALRGNGTVPMDSTRFIHRSSYFMQLQQFLPYYPKDRVLVLTQEDLLRNREETLRAAFRFLGVNETFQSEAFSTLVHESAGKTARNRFGRALSMGRERGLLRRMPPGLRSRAEKLVKSLTLSKVEKPQLDPGLRRELLRILEPDMNQFRAFTGRQFESWSA